MEFISHPVIAVILLLGILVFVHELGHFLVGRSCGIAVEIFSIGFGPALVNIRRGMTQYRISILPLGGFVKFYGSMPNEPVPPEVEGREFFSASKLSRTLTIAAGPAANFVLAFAAYSFLATQGIKLPPAQIGFVLPDGSAAEAGLMSGDAVTAIDESPIETWFDLEKIVSRSPGKSLNFKIERANASFTVPIIPNFEDGRIEGEKTKVGRIGISTGRLSSVIAPIGQDSTAMASGILPGDRVVAVVVGDEPPVGISYWDELVPFLQKQDGPLPLTLFINRDDSKEINDSTLKIAITASTAPEQITALGNPYGIWAADLVVRKIKDDFATNVLPNDRILSINGTTVKNQFDYSKAFKGIDVPKATFVVDRGGKSIELEVVLQGRERDVPEGVVTIYYLPVEFASSLTAPPPIVQNFSFLGSLGWGASETFKQSGFLLRVLGKMFSGDVALSSLGGPILIAKVAGDAAKRGFETFLSTLALISINLAVINLVPIPALDGGQLALVGAEAIRRRRLTIQTIENFQKIGFIMIMGLMVLVFYNDISRFWSRIVKSLVAPD